jgi:hypothetical protein
MRRDGNVAPFLFSLASLRLKQNAIRTDLADAP